MLFYIITALVNFITSAVLGVLVYLKSSSSAINKIFAVFCLSVAAWACFYSLWLLSGPDREAALLWGRALNIAAIFIPVTYFHLILVFLNLYEKNKLLIKASYLISFIVFIFGFTPFFVKDVAPKSIFPWYPQPGLAYHVFALMFFSCVITSWYLMIRAIRCQYDGITVFRIKYLLVGTLIGFTGGSMSFLPVYGISIPPFGSIFVPFYIIFIAFAILKYGLFEIKLILTELLIIIMGIMLFALPFLMPSTILEIITFIIFLFYSFFGFYFIKSTKEDKERREKAERVAAKERELRRQAESLAENLKRLDGAKDQFLLSTQHHLRTPLSAVRGYLSLISEGAYGPISPVMNEKISATMEATAKLIHIVDDLLDVAHYRMNKGEISKEPANVVTLIQEVVDGHKKWALAKKLDLSLEKPATPIPEILVNSKGVREAVYNIVDNAIKYTQKGSVKITLSVADGRLRIAVADTGIGMDQADKANLFVRTFERGEKAKEVNVEGKGIGLYLSAQMIAASGGTIRAESPGRNLGTTFIIEFPLAHKQSGPKS